MLKMKNKVIVFFVMIILIASFITAFPFFTKNSLKEEKSETPTCGDGTLYETCSVTKPYFCEQGILVEKISVCGCSSLSKNLGGSCYSVHQSYPEKITLKYILNRTEKEIDFTMYGEMADYISRVSRVIEYREDEKPSRADFKLKTINDEEQRELLMPLVVKIQNLANDGVEQARIAVSIVQNIPYGSTDKTVFFASGEINYSQYPYEVLYYNQGICGEKSALMAFLLKELGYGVSIFYFSEENHEVVGIKCPAEKSFRGSGYCFVETGGPAIITDSFIEYVGGIKLESEPEVIVISDGKSLPEKMQEYKDAKTMRKIREGSWFIFNKNKKFEALKKKYGLIEEYQVE